jgi:hypothetical protein
MLDQEIKWPDIPDPVSEWKSFCMELEIAGRYTPLALFAMGYYARCVSWLLYDEAGSARKLLLAVAKQQTKESTE